MSDFDTLARAREDHLRAVQSIFGPNMALGPSAPIRARGPRRERRGAADDTAAPANEFNGRIALPFITGAELAASDVASLYGIGARLLGIVS